MEENLERAVALLPFFGASTFKQCEKKFIEQYPEIEAELMIVFGIHNSADFRIQD